MDEVEIPRYKKKKSQASKASKRADHKHEYVKSITVLRNPYRPEMLSWHWTSNCSVCGRQDAFLGCNDDFRKPEYVGRRLFHAPDMFLSPREILEKFPDYPLYIEDADDHFRSRPITEEEREQFRNMGG